MASEKGEVSQVTSRTPSGAQDDPGVLLLARAQERRSAERAAPANGRLVSLSGAGRAGQEFLLASEPTAGHITHCHAQTCTCKSPSLGDHKQNSCKENSAQA